MEYPWFKLIDGDALEQGDIFEDCPVFIPPADLALDEQSIATFAWEARDVIVMSQSCDLAFGREKVTEVLLCPVWKRSELTSGHLATAKGMEDARRGNLPGFHVLAQCTIAEFVREYRVVDFRRVYALPVPFLRNRAKLAEGRLRLLPPYREHLAQSFARFFMRVGLPVDIPSFLATR